MGRHGQIVKQAGQEHRQELIRLIKQAAHNCATWQIWDDLMFFSAAAISQPLKWVQAREDVHHASTFSHIFLGIAAFQTRSSEADTYERIIWFIFHSQTLLSSSRCKESLSVL